MSEATWMLNSERQFPMTGAEQAAADGHEAEYARDVPRTCTCLHTWNRRACLYEFFLWSRGCPWHLGPPPERLA